MEEDPRFGRVNVNYNTTQPQLTLTIDREKAAALGIDINGLATTMQAMIDGAQVGNVFINDESYTVRMVSTSSPVNDPGDLESIFLKTADGRYVPMSTIATLTEAPIAPSLGREEQRRAVNVSAALDGLALGDAWTQAQAIAAPLLPEGTAIIPMAETKTIGEANNGLAHHLRLCAGRDPARARGAVRERVDARSSSWPRCRSASPARSTRCSSPA